MKFAPPPQTVVTAHTYVCISWMWKPVCVLLLISKANRQKPGNQGRQKMLRRHKIHTYLPSLLYNGCEVCTSTYCTFIVRKFEENSRRNCILHRYKISNCEGIYQCKHICKRMQNRLNTEVSCTNDNFHRNHVLSGFFSCWCVLHQKNLNQ